MRDKRQRAKHRQPPGPANRAQGFPPPGLDRHLQPLLGQNYPDLLKALQEAPPVSIRVHTTKRFEHRLEAVPWCSTGFYLDERPSFTFDPLLHAGAYYVQEASSMLLEQVFNAAGLKNKELLAMDLCAAPGGKSGHLLSLLGPGSLLVSNEIDRRRCSVLQENLWKWGMPNSVIANSPPEHLKALPACFDLIVVDAPCSGQGMFRKDPFAVGQWTPALAEQCAMTQRNMLPLAWEALRPGGVLIYSTCTWEPQENEEQLAALVAAGAIAIDPLPDAPWGLVRSDRHGAIGLRCYPHRVRGEGFFIGALRKPGDAVPRIAARAGSGPSAAAEVAPWLSLRAERTYRMQKDTIYTVDAQWSGMMDTLDQALRIVAPGAPIADLRAGSWRPHPALALSTDLLHDAFPRLELDEEQAVHFLRGQALPAHDAHDHALATHRGLGLGWLKGAGRRWNNLWPEAWRIRSQQASAPRVSWSQFASEPNEQAP
jgi:16S rRNA C967 or C1407 C5-methylase (RsmB/RsmF family)/NOL1/NOP2/fmu family ribosome biogenesis protein